MKVGFYCPKKGGKPVRFSQCPCVKPCLPVPVMRALIDSQQSPIENEWRVSELIGQPTQVILRRRKNYYSNPHAELYMLWGTMLHAMLESYADGVIAEERKKVKWDRWVISGKPDLWLPKEKKLVDYKFSNSYLVDELDKNPHHEYIMQLNLYRYLFYPKAEHLELVLFIRDHNKNMDILPIITKEVPIFAKKYIDEFLAHRIRELDIGMTMPIKELPPCPETWSGKRCQLYCDVNNFCPHYKNLIGG